LPCAFHYGWIFALDGAAEITAPAGAVEAYRNMPARAAKSFVSSKPLVNSRFLLSKNSRGVWY
jgi:hypothetical protein